MYNINTDLIGKFILEEGANKVKYELTIEFLPEKEYLAIKGYMSWREITPDEHEEWARKYFPDKSLIEQLKIKAGTNEIYTLFCNSCKKDEQFDWVCGDDIVCENINKAEAGDGFVIIRLAASEYLKVVYQYDKSCYRNH